MTSFATTTIQTTRGFHRHPPGKSAEKKKKRWSKRNVRMMAAPGTDGKTPYVAKNTFTIPRDESGVKLE